MLFHDFAQPFRAIISHPHQKTQPRRRADHVLLGDAELEVALGELLLEAARAGGLRKVGVEDDEVAEAQT